MNQDPYALLGVTRETGEQELRWAYESKLAEAQRAGGYKLAQQIDAAYSILRDDEKRRLYDRHGFTGTPRPSPYYARRWDPVPFRAWSPREDSGLSFVHRPVTSCVTHHKWSAAVLAAVLLISVGTGIQTEVSRHHHQQQWLAPSSASGQVEVVCEPAPGAAGYVFDTASGTSVSCTNGAIPSFDSLP